MVSKIDDPSTCISEVLYNNFTIFFKKKSFADISFDNFWVNFAEPPNLLRYIVTFSICGNADFLRITRGNLAGIAEDELEEIKSGKNIDLLSSGRHIKKCRLSRKDKL